MKVKRYAYLFTTVKKAHFPSPGSQSEGQVAQKSTSWFANVINVKEAGKQGVAKCKHVQYVITDSFSTIERESERDRRGGGGGGGGGGGQEQCTY